MSVASLDAALCASQDSQRTDPTASWVLDVLFDELHRTLTSDAAAKEDAAAVVQSALELLDQPPVRYRLNRIDRLAWLIAVDPRGAMPLPTRDRVVVDRYEVEVRRAREDHIAAHRDGGNTARIGRAAVVGASVSAMLPVAFAASDALGDSFIRSLPVGTLIPGREPAVVLGRIADPCRTDDSLSIETRIAEER